MKYTSPSKRVTVTDKAITPQSDNYFSSYYLAFPFEGSHQQSLKILFYRRGDQFVSVPAVSWLRFAERSMREQWKKAEILEDLEKALESIAPPLIHWNQSAASQEVRQFLAQEYTWLADSEWAAGPEKKEDRQRLLAKANEYQRQEPASSKESREPGPANAETTRDLYLRQGADPSPTIPGPLCTWTGSQAKDRR